MLESCKILKSKNNSFKLYIAGEGSERNNYTEFINSEKLTDNVFLIGHINKVREFFNQGDCVVIPSRSEGVPNALFEAWSIEKPVICSNASGLPEVIRNNENGLMVELSAISIADRMEYLINNREECSRLGKSGKLTLDNDFSLEKMRDKIKDLFSDLVISKRNK